MKNVILEKIKECNIENAYVLAYFYNKVCLGIYKNTDIRFNQEIDYSLLIEIRVFNKDLEIRAVLDEETENLKIEIVKDDIQNIGYFDEAMFIAGNKIVGENDNFTTLKQNGGNIDIPFNVKENEASKGLRLIVRNYFNVDENNQVIIENSRLVDIKKKEGEA